MESILARALEYTLKYWLKSFNRDQFKLQGRTAQLSNLDINGEALHASLGLPPALNVTTARVGKLEIILPSLSNVQIEPIVVQIDRLDIVLEENTDADASSVHNSSLSSTGATKANGYGYADKIADGMTIQVGTVNLLLETHGGTRSRGGAVWASPMASITMRNLLLYTTNEHWQVVNLKEARDFSNDKKFIYVFKKLEWGNLSIDLLPHPDMFLDANFANTKEGYNMKDKHGAKRVFFGGERFVDGISGEAFVTIQRTTLNSPVGLEVQLHITEAVCPALSEPGLRALLRFFTGFNICINRGDVNPNTQQLAEAASRSLVSVMVDHIFVCIKDTEFQLELLMQSLFFSRASISDGEKAQCLTRVMIGGFFLRDTFSRPTCTLVQPSMQDNSANNSPVPDFGKNFCPPIYPLSDERWKQNFSSPIISLHHLQLLPTPKPPSFASKTVVDCQPLMIHLQEESCLRIASFLADGITVDGGSVLPDFSINSLVFKLNGLDVKVPLAAGQPEFQSRSLDLPSECSFGGARLHIRELVLSQSPSLKMNLLNLAKDPACFCLWKNQPIDASQKKLTVGVSSINLFLETNNSLTRGDHSHMDQGLWRCIEMEGISFELAMVTADGSPLTIIPPPEGVVRVGISCQKYISNTSVEQLFFVLSLYTYFGRVSERLTLLGKNCNVPEAGCKSVGGNSMIKAPGDTSVTLAVGDLQLRFLESSSADDQGVPLVCFKGDDLSIKVGHRTLGGAMVISSTMRWERIELHCADTMNNFRLSNRYDDAGSTESHGLRAVLWIQDSRASQLKHDSITRPFLNASMVHVIPYSAQDMECHSLNVSACVAGVRLGGGMNYAESLLHRFGILGPNGGPGENLTRGLKHLADGPLSKLFKASPHVIDGSTQSGSIDDWNNSSPLNLTAPDDIDISVELKDWLFALEGTREMSNGFDSPEYQCSYREERSWHATFGSLQVKAKSSSNHATVRSSKSSGKEKKYPIELINIGMENLQILKPVASQGSDDHKIEEQALYRRGGVNVAADIVTSEDEFADATGWVFENLKFSVDERIKAVVKRDELHHIYLLLNSEVESAGRIAAGFLRILKLEESLGPAAISQLSNLGTGSFDRIFTPEKISRRTEMLGTSLSNARSLEMESIIISLEETILDSKMKCAAIATDLSSTESSVKSGCCCWTWNSLRRVHLDEVCTSLL